MFLSMFHSISIFHWPWKPFGGINNLGGVNWSLEMTWMCSPTFRGRPMFKNFWSIFMLIFTDFWVKSPLNFPEVKFSF